MSPFATNPDHEKAWQQAISTTTRARATSATAGKESANLFLFASRNQNHVCSTTPGAGAASGTAAVGVDSRAGSPDFEGGIGGGGAVAGAASTAENKTVQHQRYGTSLLHTLLFALFRFLDNHKKKLLFLGLPTIVIFLYLRKLYLKYLKPILELVRATQGMGNMMGSSSVGGGKVGGAPGGAEQGSATATGIGNTALPDQDFNEQELEKMLKSLLSLGSGDEDDNDPQNQALLQGLLGSTGSGITGGSASSAQGSPLEELLSGAGSGGSSFLQNMSNLMNDGVAAPTSSHNQNHVDSSSSDVAQELFITYQEQDFFSQQSFQTYLNFDEIQYQLYLSDASVSENLSVIRSELFDKVFRTNIEAAAARIRQLNEIGNGSACNGDDVVLAADHLHGRTPEAATTSRDKDVGSGLAASTSSSTAGALVLQHATSAHQHQQQLTFVQEKQLAEKKEKAFHELQALCLAKLLTGVVCLSAVALQNRVCTVLILKRNRAVFLQEYCKSWREYYGVNEEDHGGGEVQLHPVHQGSSSKSTKCQTAERAPGMVDHVDNQKYKEEITKYLQLVRNCFSYNASGSGGRGEEDGAGSSINNTGQLQEHETDHVHVASTPPYPCPVDNQAPAAAISSSSLVDKIFDKGQILVEKVSAKLEGFVAKHVFADSASVSHDENADSRALAGRSRTAGTGESGVSEMLTAPGLQHSPVPGSTTSTTTGNDWAAEFAEKMQENGQHDDLQVQGNNKPKQVQQDSRGRGADTSTPATTVASRSPAPDENSTKSKIPLAPFTAATVERLLQTTIHCQTEKGLKNLADSILPDVKSTYAEYLEENRLQQRLTERVSAEDLKPLFVGKVLAGMKLFRRQEELLAQRRADEARDCNIARGRAINFNLQWKSLLLAQEDQRKEETSRSSCDVVDEQKNYTTTSINSAMGREPAAASPAATRGEEATATEHQAADEDHQQQQATTQRLLLAEQEDILESPHFHNAVVSTTHSLLDVLHQAVVAYVEENGEEIATPTAAMMVETVGQGGSTVLTGPDVDEVQEVQIGAPSSSTSNSEDVRLRRRTKNMDDEVFGAPEEDQADEEMLATTSRAAAAVAATSAERSILENHQDQGIDPRRQHSPAGEENRERPPKTKTIEIGKLVPFLCQQAEVMFEFLEGELDENGYQSQNPYMQAINASNERENSPEFMLMKAILQAG
ncbi:unnamed protein product [Amoebophrya sp. A120]|nr:unnamed protein product [Amoebophrya sp. A120]|eukprot:GSA120T00014069001.1